MLVALGENDVKTIEDLAGCATDDLVGYTEGRGPEAKRHAGYLDGFEISRAEAEAHDHGRPPPCRLDRALPSRGRGEAETAEDETRFGLSRSESVRPEVVDRGGPAPGRRRDSRAA